MSNRLHKADVNAIPCLIKESHALLAAEGLLDEYLLGHGGEKAGYGSAKRLKIVRQTYEPGGSHNVHSHDLTEQAYYVAEGKARVTIGVRLVPPVRLPPPIRAQFQKARPTAQPRPKF